MLRPRGARPRRGLADELPEPKHLRIRTGAEGGGIHLMNDTRTDAVPYMLDWLREEVDGPRGTTVFP